MGLTVVKLGGSLATSPELGSILQSLEGVVPGHLVIVPGGGPFADRVRDLQHGLGFSDACAHQLALIAMRMFGRILCDRRSGWVLTDSIQACVQASVAGNVTVCVPIDEILASPAIPASWDVTSDAISAWLAARLAARRLLVVKSCSVAADADLHDLARAGVVDPNFPAFVAESRSEVRFVNCAADIAALHHWLRRSD